MCCTPVVTCIIFFLYLPILYLHILPAHSVSLISCLPACLFLPSVPSLLHFSCLACLLPLYLHYHLLCAYSMHATCTKESSMSHTSSWCLCLSPTSLLLHPLVA